MRLVARAEHGKTEYGEAIHVSLRDELPASLLWRGQRYRVVAVESTWCLEGRWWQDAAGHGLQRRYYRLSVVSSSRVPLCLEIYRVRTLWKLARIAD